MRCLLAACLTIWAACLLACCLPDDSKTAPAPTPAPGATADTQEKRARTIEGFKRERVIHKIEGDSVAKLHVMPRFYGLPLDDKKAIASLVYTWFYKVPLNAKSDTLPLGDHVQIIDHATGREVGRYDPHSGLSVDK